LQAVSRSCAGEDPADVLDFAESLEAKCHWTGFGRDGVYDVVFHARWQQVGEAAEPHRSEPEYGLHTNQPEHREIERKLALTVRDRLRRALPDYMVPSAIEVLQAWPLTPNGKIDRKRLPEPDFARRDARTGAESTSPRTPMEEILLDVWRAVLKIERIGIHESFFDLGGHSLLAAQVVSRLRALGIEMPLSMLFVAPTIQLLATKVRKGQDALAPVRPALTRRSHGGPQPLSYAQQRLWFLEEWHPGSAFYNIMGAVRLRGALDLPALERALQELVDRHETLRTRFEVLNGFPAQVMEERVEIELPFEDLSGLHPEAKRVREALARLRSAALQPFDLKWAPLFRGCLIRLAPQDHLLMLGAHHIVSDGGSMGVMIREMTVLYSAFRKGNSSPLAALPVQYADFACWQRTWLEGEAMNAQLGYWRKQLANMPGQLRLPADRSRSEEASFHTGAETFSLSADLTRAILALGRDHGGTTFMTFLAAFKVLLCYYAQQDDIVVGANVSNRGQVELEGLIGLFVNQLVLRTRLAGDPSFTETLARVRNTTLEAYANQDLPFDKLVADLRPERVLNRSPLFNVKFECSAGLWQAPVFEGLECSMVDLGLDVLRHDLHLFIDAVDPVASGKLIYDSDIFSAATIHEMLEQFQSVVAAVTMRPDAPISEIMTMLEERRRAARGLEANRISSMERAKLGAIKRKAIRVAVSKGA
jgi:hypothetical protein